MSTKKPVAPYAFGDAVVIDMASETGAALPDPDVAVVQEKDDEDTLPPQAVLLEDGSVRLPLMFPKTLRWRNSNSNDVREDHFDELLLHRLTGRDMEVIADAKRGIAKVAIARAARLMQGKFNALYDIMDGADTAAAMQVVAYFLGTGRTTGR